jgi:hypothetical protein
MTSAQQLLNPIQRQLSRISASGIRTTLDDQFDPASGTLVKVELDSSYWHLLPDRFLELLKDVPDSAGDDAVRRAIERQGMFVWHGPSPPGSRDTSN